MTERNIFDVNVTNHPPTNHPLANQANADTTTIEVTTPSNAYPIQIGQGWLSQSKILEIVGNRKYVIVTDENVFNCHRALLSTMNHLVLPPGEQTKSFDQYKAILDYLGENRFNRSSVIIAFGGGVIGDLTGFAAATYMRGIKFIQIPTTLLAMVDSSVGGKVAINHPSAKNLIGAFYQPQAVYMDVDLLKTCSPVILSDGFAEVIKYGIGFDAELFYELEQLDFNNLFSMDQIHTLIRIVSKCCQIKADIVKVDERDEGVRQLLNLGHTIGHAVEQFYNYMEYTHGQGVAIGMMIKAKIAHFEGRLSEQDLIRIKNLLLQFMLPLGVEQHADYPEILQGVKLDKKSEVDTLKWIRINRIGQCEIEVKSYDEIVSSVLSVV